MSNAMVERLREYGTVAGLPMTAQDRVCHQAADEIERQAQLVADLLEALDHIAEYWNGSENEKAMADALYHIVETADAAIAAGHRSAVMSNAESAAHRLRACVCNEFDRDSPEFWDKAEALYQAALRESRNRPRSNAYRPSADELTRSEIQGERIAMFRAEY